jgi:hypothetical protein
MKRIAVVLATLGLIGIGPAMGADEKSESKTEHKADSAGSSTSTESSSKKGGAKVSEKTDVEHHTRSDGTTETKKHTKKKSKPAGRMTSDKSESKEKTVLIIADILRLSTNPKIRDEAELTLEGSVLRRVTARRLTLAVRSSGDLWRHRADVDLRLAPLEGDGDGHLVLSAQLDRARRSSGSPASWAPGSTSR